MCEAAKILGRSPTWMTERAQASDIIKKHLSKLVELRIDRAEQAADRLLAKDNATMVIFILKTLGRKRGYVEHAPKDEVDYSGLEALGRFFQPFVKAPPTQPQANDSDTKHIAEEPGKTSPEEKAPPSFQSDF